MGMSIHKLSTSLSPSLTLNTDSAPCDGDVNNPHDTVCSFSLACAYTLLDAGRTSRLSSRAPRAGMWATQFNDVVLFTSEEITGSRRCVVVEHAGNSNDACIEKSLAWTT